VFAFLPTFGILEMVLEALALRLHGREMLAAGRALGRWSSSK
jgi:hypothetical protein